MSKIEQLIKEKCPNGVEYKKLKELVDYIQPTKYIVKDTRYDDKYDIPVLTAGQTFILGYTNEEIGIYKADKNNPVIIFDDFTTSNHWIDFQFKVKSSAMKILIPKTQDVFKYIYYCIQNIKYIPKEHSRQWIQTFSEFKIPLPPLEVQEEIVKILDKFSELDAELETELETRKKQYEFWNAKIFNSNIKKYKLGELCNITSGGTPSKRNSEYWENGDIKWLGSSVCKSKKKIDGITDYITDLGLKKSSAKMLKPGTTLIAMVGATIGKVAYLNFEACTNQNVASLWPKSEKILNNEYLFYACSNLYNDFLNLSKGGFAMANLRFIKNLEIPVPSIQEQERIVKILDKFDKLINDISEGIPAEMEARREQYEYYRNKLLSFEELKTNE